MPKEEKKYTFTVQTNRGAASLAIPEGDMKACPCGCDLFRMVFRVTWFQPETFPRPDPICFRVEVYVCNECGRELGKDNPAKRDLPARLVEAN